MRPAWSYQGQLVQIPFTADIPTNLRPDGEFGYLVQQVLDSMDPWTEDVDPIETVEFDHASLRSVAVANCGNQIYWGIHVGHKAKRPQPSPFTTNNRQATTQLLTIELVGTPEKPRLVRAYPGDYIPPLPWQASSRQADGGPEACRQYWHSHSYVLKESLVVGGSKNLSTTPPEWTLS